MERCFTLDKESAKIFSGLHPDDPKDWFKDDSVAMGALSDDVPAALILATVSEDTVWLDWLYVKEEYRGCGIGMTLLNKFSESLMNYGGDHLIHTACEDDMKDYLTRMGFEFSVKPEFSTFSAPLSEMIEMTPANKPEKIYHLSGLSKINLNRINELFYSTPDIPQGIPLPVEPGKYLEESAVYISENRIKAMLFLENADGAINVSYAYSSPDSPDKLMYLVAEARRSLAERFGEDVRISATALNNESESLIKHLFPGAERSNVWKGEMVMFL